jgi:hypothetical protein
VADIFGTRPRYLGDTGPGSCLTCSGGRGSTTWLVPASSLLALSRPQVRSWRAPCDRTSLVERGGDECHPPELQTSTAGPAAVRRGCSQPACHRRRQNFGRHGAGRAADVVVVFVAVPDLGVAQAGSRFAIRYAHVEIYGSARKHGVADADIVHAIEHAVAGGEQDDGKVLYLGPDRAANLLEVVSVARDDGTEIVIHAMPMRSKYEPFLHGEGDSDA